MENLPWASLTPKTPSHRPSSATINTVNADYTDFATPAPANREAEENSILRDDLIEELTPLISAQWLDLEDGLYQHLQRSEELHYFCLCFNPRFLVLVVGTLLFVLLMCWLLARNLPELLSDAINSEILSVAVLDISDTGLSVHVTGSFDVDYSRVKSSFYSFLLKTAALVVGGVTVDPEGASKLLVALGDSKLLHFADLFLPDLSVDVINGRLTQFDFISDVAFVAENVPPLANAYLAHNSSEPLDVQLTLQLDPKVLSGFFAFSAGVTDIGKSVSVPPDQLRFPVAAEHVLIGLGESIYLDAQMVLDALPIKTDVPPVDWIVSIADCADTPSYLGNWTSDPCLVSPYRLSEFAVHGSTNLPLPLLHQCPLGVSPISAFINNITENHILEVFIQALDSQQNSKNLPKWLLHILTETPYRVQIPISLVGSGSLLLNVQLDGFDLVVPHQEDLILEASGTTQMHLNLPFSTSHLALDVRKFDVSATVAQEQDLVLSATMNGAARLSGGDEAKAVNAIGEIDKVALTVVDPKRAGMLVSDFLKGEEIGPLSVAAELASGEIVTPFANTTLQDVRWRGDGAVPAKGGWIDRILPFLDISVDRILLREANAAGARFSVEISLINPFNASLRLPNEVISVDYSFHNVVIGNASLPVDIPQSDERVLLTLDLWVDCTTVEARKEAEFLMSHVISQDYNISMGVGGSEQAAANPKLREFLRNVQVPVKFPDLLFPAPPELLGPNPFVVEATVHILTSEVEVRVFNPIENSAVEVRVVLCQALYEDNTIAFVEHVMPLLVPPGVYSTPRIPYKVSPGFGSDVLRRTLNGELEVDVVMDIVIGLGPFDAQLLYKGHGIRARVRL